MSEKIWDLDSYKKNYKNFMSEFERIQKMKDFRKLFADSIVQTTHLLKKQVMIPIKYDDDGNIEET